MEKVITIDITEAISPEAFGKILKAYNDLKGEETIDIYLNTSGGDAESGDAMVDIINNNAKVTNLIAYGKICSAGFDLYFKARCPKRLLDGTIGMAHLARVEMENFTVTNSKEQIEAGFYKSWWMEDKKKRLKFYEELGMEKKELLKIKKGGDVYFPYNRLLELLNGKS